MVVDRSIAIEEVHYKDAREAVDYETYMRINQEFRDSSDTMFEVRRKELAHEAKQDEIEAAYGRYAKCMNYIEARSCEYLLALVVHLRCIILTMRCGLRLSHLNDGFPFITLCS